VFARHPWRAKLRRSMNRIIITTRPIRNNEKIINAIHFARLLNSLQSTKRVFINVAKKNDENTLLDRLELIICHGAIVYETTKEIWKERNILSKLKKWREKTDLVDSIKHEYTNNGSFTNRCLKDIRNKIYFHYDKDVIQKAIHLLNEDEKVEFARAKTEYDHDISFVLSEEIIIKYILDPIREKNNENDKWEYFQNELAKKSQTLTDLLSVLVVELIKPFSEIERE
jgi:hypothetical protein